MAQQQIDSYHILEEIAAWGQASVHKAWDTRTGQIVALKVIHPHLAKDPGYLQRFHWEARLAASIGAHPNVVRIFDVGQSGDAHYMALEYLPLSLHNLNPDSGPFPCGPGFGEHAAGGHRATGSPRPGHRPSGYQASEHPYQFRWHSKGHRLRYWPGRGLRNHDPNGSGDGDTPTTCLQSRQRDCR